MNIICLLLAYKIVKCHLIALDQDTQFAFSDGTIAALQDDQVVVRSLVKPKVNFSIHMDSAQGIDQNQFMTLVWNHSAVQVIKLHPDYTLEYHLTFTHDQQVSQASFMSQNIFYTKFGDSSSIIDMSDKNNKISFQQYTMCSTTTFHVFNASERIHFDETLEQYPYEKDQVMILANQLTPQHPYLINIHNHISYQTDSYDVADIYSQDNSYNYQFVLLRNKTICVSEISAGEAYSSLKLHLKFSFQSLVLALMSHHAVCYQYVKLQGKLSKYGNVLCMQVRKDLLIKDDHYNQNEHKLLLFLEGPNSQYVDQYDQCLLYQFQHYTCNICTDLLCFNSCPKLVSQSCQRKTITIQIKSIMMGQIFIMAFVMMAFILLYNILKQVNWNVVNRGIAIIFRFMFCTFEFMDYIFEFMHYIFEMFCEFKLRYIFYPFRLVFCTFRLTLRFIFCDCPASVYRFGHFLVARSYKFLIRKMRKPLEISPCPICLGELSGQVFFPCLRHMACEQCMKLYQKQFTVEQLRCPFRD